MCQPYTEEEIKILAHPPLDNSTEPGKKTNKIVFDVPTGRICFHKQNDAVRSVPIKLSSCWVDIGCYSVQVAVLEKILKFHKERFNINNTFLMQ